MNHLSALKPAFFVMIAALFAFICVVAQPSDSFAQQAPETTMDRGPNHGPGGGPGAGPNRGPGPGPAARPAPGPGPRPAPGPRPGHRPPPPAHHYYNTTPVVETVYVCDTPACNRESYIGGVIGGASTMVVGLALGIPALFPSLWEDDSPFADDPYYDDEQQDIRLALGITGASVFVLGAIITGIYGYQLSEWNTQYGSNSLEIAPTFGGATLTYRF